MIHQSLTRILIEMNCLSYGLWVAFFAMISHGATFQRPSDIINFVLSIRNTLDRQTKQVLILMITND